MTDTVATARGRLGELALPGAPVLDRAGRFQGSVDLGTLSLTEETETLERVKLDDRAVSADDSLGDALGVLADLHRSWIPVVSSDRLLGILSSQDILGAYRVALAGNVRQIRAVGAEGVLVEADIGPDSTLAGLSVATAPWPRDVVLVSVERADRLIVPRGDLVLKAGDHLTVFTATAGRPALDALLGQLREATVGLSVAPGDTALDP